MVAFLVGGPFAIEAVSVYLVAYAIMTLGAFAAITLLAPPDSTRDADVVEDYRGLFWLRPGLSLAFAACLLSLAGIPLTAGLIAKFHAVASGVDVALVLLLIGLGAYPTPLLTLIRATASMVAR